MTEDEARQHWCPFASSRVVTTKTSPTDTNQNAQASSRTADGKLIATVLCLGSQCMAWRWTRAQAELGELGDNHPRDYVTGFCGLAGRPS